MSKIINLPSGATATLRDPRSLKHKDRRQIIGGVSVEKTVSNGYELIDNMIAVLVEEWSLDLLPPSVKMDSLGELSIPDYDALQKEAEEAMGALFPQLAKTDQTEADPKATTGSSNA